MVEVPPVKEFERALSDYHSRWPRDGYYLSRQRFAATYDLMRRYYAGGTIVDIGGWPGDFACTLASLRLPVCVLDKNPARPTSKVRDPKAGAYVLSGTTTLSDKCRQYGIELVRCDIERETMPFEDRSLEMVLCTEVIAHLRVGLLHALGELRRVLSPTGRLLLSTPNLLSLTNRLSFLLGRSEFEGLALPFDALAAEEHIGHGGIYRSFSMRELTDLLVRTGFRIVYAGYRHLVTADQAQMRWSPAGLRTVARDRMASWIAPLGNALFVVVEADGR